MPENEAGRPCRSGLYFHSVYHIRTRGVSRGDTSVYHGMIHLSDLFKDLIKSFFKENNRGSACP